MSDSTPSADSAGNGSPTVVVSVFGLRKRTWARHLVLRLLGLGFTPNTLFVVDPQTRLFCAFDTRLECFVYLRVRSWRSMSSIGWTLLPRLWSKRLERQAEEAIKRHTVMVRKPDMAIVYTVDDVAKTAIVAS